MKNFTFKAYGLKWKVRVVSRHEKIKGNFGFFDYPTETIFILKDASERQQWSTLLHELIHLVGEVNGLNLSENSVLTLEVGLYQILTDNRIEI